MTDYNEQLAQARASGGFHMPSFLAGAAHAVGHFFSPQGDPFEDNGQLAGFHPQDVGALAANSGAYPGHVRADYRLAGSPTPQQAQQGVIPGTVPQGPHAGQTYTVPGINDLVTLQHLAALRAQTNPGALLQSYGTGHGRVA